jgi:hypothetical protein
VEPAPARRASSQVYVVTQELLKENSAGRDARLCGNLTLLTRHVKSQKYGKHGGQSAFCCLTAHFRCMVCNERLHFLPSTGIANGYDCFFKWHDEAFFGLGSKDSVCIFNTRKKDWTQPNRTVRQRNERHINRLKNDENDNSTEDDSSSNIK